MKRCPKCGETKPLADFYRDGRAAYCKPCTKADVRRWQRENHDRFRRTQRRSMLKRKYGLTEESLTLLIDGQQGVCLICETKLDATNLNVDHDHATGRVRGVLCARCNKTIGLLRDDPRLLRNAAAYLRSY